MKSKPNQVIETVKMLSRLGFWSDCRRSGNANGKLIVGVCFITLMPFVHGDEIRLDFIHEPEASDWTAEVSVYDPRAEVAEKIGLTQEESISDTETRYSRDKFLIREALGPIRDATIQVNFSSEKWFLKCDELAPIDLRQKSHISRTVSICSRDTIIAYANLLRTRDKDFKLSIKYLEDVLPYGTPVETDEAFQVFALKIHSVKDWVISSRMSPESLAEFTKVRSEITEAHFHKEVNPRCAELVYSLVDSMCENFPNLALDPSNELTKEILLFLTFAEGISGSDKKCSQLKWQIQMKLGDPPAASRTIHAFVERLGPDYQVDQLGFVLNEWLTAIYKCHESTSLTEEDREAVFSAFDRLIAVFAAEIDSGKFGERIKARYAQLRNRMALVASS